MIVMSYRDDYQAKRYWPWIIVMSVIFLWIAYYNAASSDSVRLSAERFYFILACIVLAFISLFFERHGCEIATGRQSKKRSLAFLGITF